MKNKSIMAEEDAVLRRNAEERVADLPENLESLSPLKISEILHELRVHQIELSMQNEALRQAQQETDAARTRYFDLYDRAPAGYCTISEKGIILEANLTAATLSGVPKNAMVQQPLSKFIFSEDQEIYYSHFRKSFQTGEPHKCDLRMVTQDGATFWVHLEAVKVQDAEGAPVYRFVISDITDRKQAEEALKKIEWMLISKPAANDIEDQGYGDITTLNRGGLISRSIGKGTLKEISTEFLNLLETSSAIYEKNGDYAYGIFCSGWCRIMDSASRKRCHTEDNAAALASGKWLCHESCWTDCSKLAIESRSPVDIECKGGIHLYAVPIFSAGEVIGAINFGYGDPPRDAERLKSLADSYGLDTETLAKEADEFASRPAYIIELAKQRLLSSARLIGIMVDRKRAEESLREQLDFSESLIETAQAIILVLDTQGRIVQFNSYMEELVGYGLDEVRGMDWFRTFLTPEDGHTVKPLFQKTVAGIQTSGNVNPIIAKDGRSIPVEWYNKTLKDKDGRTVGILAIGQDITEREQAEVEKKRLETQLHQAQKMESIGRLAGGVAHDFNNMLMVILGYTEMSLDMVNPADHLYENLTEIRNSAKRSADLTRQLLAFARKQSITPKVLDINEIVAGMLKMLQRLIGENINLHWQQGNDLWQVKVDPSQLDQILANLSVNARDAIDGVGNVLIATGNVTCDKVYFSNYPYALPGDYVLLTVSDDGCGMEKEVLNNLFEPFFTTKEFGKGTGLGLATVYGIVKQNNGFINVHSEPGKRTTFKIYLPRYMENVPQIEKEDRKEPAAHGHETILLVEDEPAILKMGKIMLESLGYKVLTADLPIQAINIAKDHASAIDLLITDVIMPEMHGRDLARNILSILPAIKCLFMSGYTADVIARDGILDEGMHFIQKPFSRNALAEKVRNVLVS